MVIVHRVLSLRVAGHPGSVHNSAYSLSPLRIKDSTVLVLREGNRRREALTAARTLAESYNQERTARETRAVPEEAAREEVNCR
jgi:hypothetical protein